MIDVLHIGAYTVEHHDMYSNVYKNGRLVSKFEGNETSWSDAERWAWDQTFAEANAD